MTGCVGLGSGTAGKVQGNGCAAARSGGCLSRAAAWGVDCRVFSHAQAAHAEECTLVWLLPSSFKGVNGPHLRMLLHSCCLAMSEHLSLHTPIACSAHALKQRCLCMQPSQPRGAWCLCWAGMFAHASRCVCCHHHHRCVYVHMCVCEMVCGHGVCDGVLFQSGTWVALNCSCEQKQPCGPGDSKGAQAAAATQQQSCSPRLQAASRERRWAMLRGAMCGDQYTPAMCTPAHTSTGTAAGAADQLCSQQARTRKAASNQHSRAAVPCLSVCCHAGNTSAQLHWAAPAQLHHWRASRTRAVSGCLVCWLAGRLPGCRAVWCCCCCCRWRCSQHHQWCKHRCSLLQPAAHQA